MTIWVAANARRRSAADHSSTPWSGKDLRQLLDRIESMPPSAPEESVTRRRGRRARIPPSRCADAERPRRRCRPIATSSPGSRSSARVSGGRGCARRAPRGGWAARPQAPRRRKAADKADDKAHPRPPGPASAGPTYGANLASHRYSPADQITKDNFNRLGIAWRLKTDFLGPRPDTLYSATPLVVDRTLYTTAGMRRAVIALDAVTGEMRWMHSEDEGLRGQNAPRTGAGRGLAYWANGNDRRIIYVTPGYRLLALDARTGNPIPTFGNGGAVDLKLEADQEVDLDTAELGLNATPLVVGDVIVVGVAHRAGTAPRTMRNAKGMVRGYDVRTGKRLWIFNTLPQTRRVRLRHVAGELGGVQRQHRRLGADERRRRSSDWSTCRWRCRRATTTAATGRATTCSPTAWWRWTSRPERASGITRPCTTTCGTGIWRARRFSSTCSVNGRTVKAIAQPTKHAFLFVFNRETGEPIWPIEERPVPQSDVPKERTSPTQPFPTKPAPFDRQGISENDLLDLTPALKAEAIDVAKRYKMGPLFTPPVVSSVDGPLGTLTLPSEVGGANWPGGSFDPANNHLYIHSHAQVYVNGLVPRQSRAVGHGIRRRTGSRRRRWRGRGGARRGPGAVAAPAGGGGRGARPSRDCR